MDAKQNKVVHPFRKLNDEMIDKLVTELSEGSTQKLAAECNGITEKIFYIWIAQGRLDVDASLDTLPAKLVQSLAKVKANEVKKCRKNIVDNDKGHKGAEWTLEHAYWREFGSNENLKELAEEIAELRSKKARESKSKGVDEDGEELDSRCD